MVRIVHERQLDASVADVGALLDTLASSEDRLWPTERWPPMELDPGLEVGAHGGHGPVRYSVSDYEPGRRVCFRFDPSIFDGHHWFEVTTRDGETYLRHVAEGHPRGVMRIAWSPALRFMHDAAVEDCLDRAEAELRGAACEPRSFNLWVRTLRTAGRIVMGEAAVGSGPQAPADQIASNS